MLTISYKDVVETDVSFLERNYKRVAHIENSFYTGLPQLEPYKLLAYLSHQFHFQTILDVGTWDGLSAMALSQNETNRVITYDILGRDYNTFISPKIQHTPIADSYPNLEFKNLDINQESDEVLLSASLIYLDINHNQEDEKKFSKRLEDINYSGYLLCDDVYALGEWFTSLPWEKVYVTEVGHTTGTGLVDCGNNGVRIKL